MKLQTMVVQILVLSSIVSSSGFAAEKQGKGLMPELRIDSTDETANQRKSLQSEVLISKTENQAIQSLIAIIKRRKGQPGEADLWYRLAELYMRRAKSGRFFDLSRNSDAPIKFAPPEVISESSADSLKRAIQVYTKIEREFPKFKDMDAVFFNNAFASQQVKLNKNSEALYFKVVTQFPKSSLVPDSYLALGEMAYDARNFKEALEYFKAIEKYPSSKVYSYGLYKSAWTLYNLHQGEEAIAKLVEVVKFQDPLKATNDRAINHNLRAESLRDLALFFEEKKSAEEAYSFFAKIATPDEVGDAMYNMAKIYDSHSRHKEMNIFLADFAKKQPLSPFRVKMQMLLTTGNETARQRQEALKHLIIASQLCQKDSQWRVANSNIAEPECDYDFAKTNVEMAKKWWDLWQKNKNATAAKEIATYTQEAFKIHLDREDPAKPDTKSRYAYAELLYQLGDYRKASEQYQFVSQKSLDTQISHDAAYSALVSLEKAREKEKSKNPADDDQLVALGGFYLTKYPKGEHATQIKFKTGFIAYERENFVEAEKWLKPLASDPKGGEFKRKSEDLILDILNSRKDYAGIKAFSEVISQQTTDGSRKNALAKIQREAAYSEIQEYAKSAPASEKSKAADKLISFFKANKDAPLAKDSLWQALSMYHADGKVIEGAEAAHLYAKTYPQDPRSIDALKDAAKNYSDVGLILPAAEMMETIARLSPKDREKYSEAALELYLIEGKNKLVQESLRNQLETSPQKDHGKIYARLLSTMKGQENSPEYKKIEDKIASLGIEPYASEVRIRKVEGLFNAGKLSDAFNAAKPLVSSETKLDDDIRARARIIQAKVLEKEFIDTRTKTTVERLATVLSIKTEKLDKAQTAFLTSAKIAKNPNIKLQALQGLNRIYTNYVDTVGHPIVKDEASLSDSDKKLLADQLAQLVSPIAQKKVETDKQLQSLAKEFKAAGTNEVDYSNLPFEETVKPRIQSVSGENLAAFLPIIPEQTEQMPISFDNVSRYVGSNEKCSAADGDKDLSFTQLNKKANVCAWSKSGSATEKIATWMIRKDPQSPLGVFYLSLAADMMGQYEKSEWLINLAMKKAGEAPFLLYQKARSLYGQKDIAQANAVLLKAYDLGLKTFETILMHGVVSFAQGDCLTTIDDFAKLDKSTVQKYNLSPAISECHAQTGEFDKALAAAESSVKASSNPVEVWLQIARIQESFRFDSAKALSSYESALAAILKSNTTSADMKNWIQSKVDFLKGKSGINTHREVANEGKGHDKKK